MAPQTPPFHRHDQYVTDPAFLGLNPVPEVVFLREFHQSDKDLTGAARCDCDEALRFVCPLILQAL